jgi:hypothetical protein
VSGCQLTKVRRRWLGLGQKSKCKFCHVTRVCLCVCTCVWGNTYLYISSRQTIRSSGLNEIGGGGTCFAPCDTLHAINNAAIIATRFDSLGRPFAPSIRYKRAPSPLELINLRSITTLLNARVFSHGVDFCVFSFCVCRIFVRESEGERLWFARTFTYTPFVFPFSLWAWLNQIFQTKLTAAIGAHVYNFSPCVTAWKCKQCWS